MDATGNSVTDKKLTMRTELTWNSTVGYTCALILI